MKSLFSRIVPFLCRAICIVAALCEPVQAAEPTGFIGKNDWLFYRYEFAEPSDAEDTQASLHLLQKVNQLFERNGIALALVIVPSKIRIYADQLPAHMKINSYTDGKYDQVVKSLRAGGVRVVDLNRAFLNSPLRNSDTPLFLRLDTHWSPAGAMLAAEAVKAEIDSNPILKAALAATKEEKYSIAWAKQKSNKKERDLVRQLPPNAPNFPPEQVLPFKAIRARISQADLLTGGDAVEITSIGSSYSDSVTGFPDGMRYTLQRDILDISIPVLQGPWVGMETYLRDQAFQTKKPKLIIWEIPEREMRSPPNYKFREARYLSDNSEWLLRVAALAQDGCNPSPVKVTLVEGGLVAGASGAHDFSGGPTKAGDFIELHFDAPLGRLDYLLAVAGSSDAKSLVFEASGDDGGSRQFVLPVIDDGAAHPIKLPLLSHAKGFTKVRIFPGVASTFALKEVQVCRHPDALLH